MDHNILWDRSKDQANGFPWQSARQEIANIPAIHLWTWLHNPPSQLRTLDMSPSLNHQWIKGRCCLRRNPKSGELKGVCAAAMALMHRKSPITNPRRSFYFWERRKVGKALMLYPPKQVQLLLEICIQMCKKIWRLLQCKGRKKKARRLRNPLLGRVSWAGFPKETVKVRKIIRQPKNSSLFPIHQHPKSLVCL